jgi:hypothetical protein
MTPDRYSAYIATMCTCAYLRPYKDVLINLQQLDMAQRSAIATLCRAQCYPHRSTRLTRMTKSLSPSLKHKLLPLCQDPITAGLLLQMVLLAPLSHGEIRMLYSKSKEKEVDVMCSQRRKCTIDFQVFFGDYDRQINDCVPQNRQFAEFVHRIIDKWIERIKAQILFPKLGSKTVSKMTAREILHIDKDYHTIFEVGTTPIDLEWIYHTHGIKIEGPCELRQKWYCSNLKPRTYFTQGGTAYHSSKYLANAFVDLCDSLPSTNRRTRVDPGRIVIRNPMCDVAYYDLTSFTSNLHVQREFMTQLAKYCEGVTVYVLDSVQGIIPQDLGELIHQYVEHNLLCPSYTIPTRKDEPNWEMVHNVAGFLGVYGNIATATFIHGIVMGMLHSNLDENNVAGDDGLSVTEDVERTLETVELMGIVHDEKTFRDSEGCCIHLKRPIQRIGNKLLHKQLVTWPSLEPGEEETDPRYPYLKDLTRRERKDVIASSVTALLRKIDGMTITSDKLEIVDTFISMVYRTYGLPLEGFVPQTQGNTSGFIPTYEKRFIGLDPIYNTLSRNYRSMVKLPLREYIKMDVHMLFEENFRCNSNKCLKHLEALGYVTQEKVGIVVLGVDGMRQLLKEYQDPDPPIYQYTIVKKLPKWVVDYVVS